MKLAGIKTKYLAAALTITLMLATGAGCSTRGPASAGTSTVNTSQTSASAPAAIKTSQSSAVSPDPRLELPDFADLIAEARPSVVAVNTQTTVRGFFGGAFTQEGAGSGWIIGSNGLIITNNHVIEGASNVTVTLENGQAFSAQDIKADPAADLAIIKIEANNLPALKVGDSSQIAVGNWVVAIGNSLGMGISATKGIVSALGVSVSDSSGETLTNLIQTDAAINPGNSGGPLLNLNGEVIGINCAKVEQVGVEGMGYAISINGAMNVINQLKTEISS